MSVKDAVELLLRSGASLVSAHEHAGSELVHHREGVEHRYQQSVDTLMGLLRSVARQHIGAAVGPVGALVLPMPFYRALKPQGAPVDPATCTDVIRQRNLRLLDDCARYRDRHGPDGGVPMAAALVDPFRSAEDFAAELRHRRDEIFALKWHPPALESPVDDHVAAGYLDLSAEWNIPTVIHCSPTGRLGDLDEIRTHALPVAARAGVRVSIAHLAFLAPELPTVLDQPGVFADLGPWEAVCERTVGRPDPALADRRLACVMERNPDALMFSLDTPWHLQPWDDGRVLGASVADAVTRVRAAGEMAGLDSAALLHGTALRLLFGPGADA
ncbi:hypothetical protein AQI88_16605 [Streptomyces cellostaticus]|uniref:Amidohydrolase-related domain-containing protein n=1 Tax=Streptomyces cellostaticus TaxID=67285 RepID=A0A101NLW1_9ACTN|nr:hypothetical protein [Streptomyces cellostaticus]KUM95681.1 hypothetical protein AQI88_16605 [Streptomyces cellostaticus]GHI09720.1 hypothetical protein Scel_80410 [Streptomyces cellostaticus]